MCAPVLTCMTKMQTVVFTKHASASSTSITHADRCASAGYIERQKKRERERESCV